MDSTTVDRDLNSVTWKSGDWVVTPNNRPPYNGIEIIATPSYESNDLIKLNLVIRDFTKDVEGSDEDRIFSPIRNMETIVFPIIKSNLFMNYMVTDDTLSKLKESNVKEFYLDNLNKIKDKLFSSEQDFLGELNKIMEIEPDKQETPDLSLILRFSVFSQPDSQSNFTISGSLELRFTTEVPEQVLIFANLEYGLESTRHHVEGGILEVPLMSPTPSFRPSARTEDDTPKDDAPQVDVPQGDVPQDDVPQDDVPQVDVPQVDASQADAVTSVQGLVKVFQSQSSQTAQIIKLGETLGISQHEISLSDMNLLAISKSVTEENFDLKTTFPQDTEPGASWLWTLKEKTGQEVIVLVQTKMLDIKTMSYITLDQKIGRYGPLQIDAFIATAEEMKATPIYVLYNYISDSPADSGCLFALARTLVPLVHSNKKSWSDIKAEAEPKQWDQILSLSSS